MLLRLCLVQAFISIRLDFCGMRRYVSSKAASVVIGASKIQTGSVQSIYTAVHQLVW